ncbi:MAG: GreA/GreB family elongation factor [Vibrio toranzoniae]|jgi:transcription elongation GreA/GreB family factor|uniref:GreA/GreB family elongation factor n=1 Tax=Vibrio TaxID=662 RepID=UPI00137794F8|nr:MULTISPECIES: GreA/GreB family elongation factor [Vibrio]MDA0145381.1 GreA/GreB family elongation factor [Vibrio sp. RW]NAZ93520.1 transcription elongation factor [Vibrio toranzoniae]NAZ96764.1 transcription elongation factor [Vibrio toranzoniae]
MNKSELRQIILEQLESRLRIAQSATQRAIDAATDEETVPEHKYDTLALEASYLAHGQAMRVQECEDDIQCYRNLVLRDSEKITVSSYVVVIDENDEYKHFFIGPRVGGLSVTWNHHEIAIVTVNAPFGKALMGKEVGDEIEFKVADKLFCYEVVSID